MTSGGDKRDANHVGPKRGRFFNDLFGRSSSIGGIRIKQMHLVARLFEDGREHQHAHGTAEMVLGSRRRVDQQDFGSRTGHDSPTQRLSRTTPGERHTPARHVLKGSIF